MLSVSQLDALDRAVLGVLSRDGRASARRIAQELKVAQSTARTRLNRLLDSQIVHVVGIADPAAMGRPLAYFIRFDIVGDPGPAIALAESIPDAGWSALVNAGTRIALQATVGDVEAMVTLMDTLRTSDSVAKIEAEMILRTHAGGDISVERPALSDFQVDDIDRLLIAELGVDGRKTYTAMADSTGLSIPSVRERVLRLIRSNVVRIDTVANPDAFGRHRLAALAVRVHGPIATVVNNIVRVPAVTYAVEVAGTVDLRVEVACEDDNDLAAVTSGISQLDEVASVEVTPYSRLIRHSGLWVPNNSSAVAAAALA